MRPDFNSCQIFIAPYSKTSDALWQHLQCRYQKIQLLGFIDRQQKGENIYTAQRCSHVRFDYILILSPNHYQSIYADLAKVVSPRKILMVRIINNQYCFYSRYEWLWQQIRNWDIYLKRGISIFFNRLASRMGISRKQLVFINRQFVSANNLAFFVYCVDNHLPAVLLTDNKQHYQRMRTRALPVYLLQQWQSWLILAVARYVIVDQGSAADILKLTGSEQKKIQLWHGVPLERMNRLSDIEYDYFISTAKQVSDDTFRKIFSARQYLVTGYPRNDVLLQEHHADRRLVLTDMSLYQKAKDCFLHSNSRVIVYMPTFRESDFGSGDSQLQHLGLNLRQLDKFLQQIDAICIIKLHPFVSVFYKDMQSELQATNIFLFPPQDDIYPVLKYTHLLITDYSSVYADFLLLDRAIVFYLYDHGFCSKMAHGYLYDYDSVTPGEKVYSQPDLQQAIKQHLNGRDDYKKQRQLIRKKFFEHVDAKSSQRLCAAILQS